jgi:hypothetical protein
MFALEVWDESEKVTFYTVKNEESATSETDDFYDRFENSQYHESLEDLTSLIFDTIGSKYGAIDDFFRPEDNVEAIPPKGNVLVEEVELYYPQFPLRLYVYRIPQRYDIVILFNGGEKKGESNIDSGSLNMKFRDAKIYGKKIDEALKEGMIVVNEQKRRLEYFNGDLEIFL